HTPIPSPIAHLQVHTGVHAQSSVASAGAKNQVNWNPFLCREFLGKDARRDERLHSSCRGGESGHANNQRKALHLGPADHAESVVFDASIPIIGHLKFEYSTLSCSATCKN
ncbi:MAG TPA: hypothetical protein VJ255_09130, partial [Candidatus Acidoferrum sp.]|nr:hypothetical protein [Candidatus Acidoferrum sp.]